MGGKEPSKTAAEASETPPHDDPHAYDDTPLRYRLPLQLAGGTTRETVVAVAAVVGGSMNTVVGNEHDEAKDGPIRWWTSHEERLRVVGRSAWSRLDD